MATDDHSDFGAMGMANLMDAAQAVVQPESAQLHGLPHAELDVDGQASSLAIASARADGYTPVLLLGQGVSADVWRCADEGLHREIAAKTIRPNGQGSPEACEAMLRCEAEVLSKLSHPGIVHVIRHGGRGYGSYLAMQFVDGDTLLLHCKILELDLERRLALFKRVLEIAAYLHDEGVVHGDLKPEHILVREGGHPVFIDFGLAARWRYAEQVAAIPQRIGGSGPYCAPEVAEGLSHRPDPRQDVYALGVMLQELISERQTDRLSEALAGLCDQATASNPAERLPDAAEMLRALEGIVASQSAEQGDLQSSPSQRTAVSKLAALGVLCLLVLAAVITAKMPIGSRGQSPILADRQDFSSLQRVPTQPGQRAGLLEGILLDVQRGAFDVAGESLAAVTAESPSTQTSWEARHLSLRVAGAGLVHPFTEDPYKATFVIDAAYDSQSSTLAYIRPDGRSQEIWVQAEGQASYQVARTTKFIQALAIAPDANHLAGLVSGGEVVVWTLDKGEDNAVKEQILPRPIDAKAVWFGADGGLIFVFSPSSRTVEFWSIREQHEGFQLIGSIDACDHAYPLPSGQGRFMVATQTEGQPTRLRLVDEQGVVIRSLDMQDGSLPACADTLPHEDAMICLGMPNGYIRLHQPERGWLEPVDLGINQTVTAVLYSPEQARVFAAMDRVHLLDTDGDLIMRLGNRDAPSQLIRSLYYNQDNASLTGVSLRQAWRWLCAPSAGKDHAP